MDVQVAINVFLRRVAIEKGLPMSMTASTPTSKEHDVSENCQVQLIKDYTYKTRSNNTITKEMVDDLWSAFVRYSKGLGEIRGLSDDVSENTGMNRGSAFIYLTILSNLIKGEPNTRTLKFKDLEYLMGEIKSQLCETVINIDKRIKEIDEESSETELFLEYGILFRERINAIRSGCYHETCYFAATNRNLLSR